MVSIPTTVMADTSEALIRLALRGDEAAFAQIVRLHHRDMVRVAFVVCGDQGIAEDAVANAWPIVWRKLGGLREPDRLRPWLSTIAANEARKLVGRRPRASVREISVDSHPGAGAHVHPDPAARADDLDLEAARAGAPPADRSLIALRYVVVLTSPELGRAPGMSAWGPRARHGRLH